MLVKKNKGQIGETLTWIVATIIIIISLLFFIFGASLLGKTKKIGSFKESLTQESTSGAGGIFLKKSIFTYLSLKSESEKESLNKELVLLSSQGKFNLDYNQTKKEILARYDKK